MTLDSSRSTLTTLEAGRPFGGTCLAKVRIAGCWNRASCASQATGDEWSFHATPMYPKMRRGNVRRIICRSVRTYSRFAEFSAPNLVLESSFRNHR